MASTETGSTSKAAPSVLGSGLATTGRPQFMASTGGSPKPSTKRDVGQQPGHAVEGGQDGSGDKAGEDHAGLRLDSPAPAARAHHEQRPRLGQLPAGTPVGGEQALVVLPRFEGAHAQEEGTVDAQLEQQPGTGVEVGRRQVVRAQGDDGDRVRGGAGFHQVVRHHLGGDDEPVGPAHGTAQGVLVPAPAAPGIGIGKPAPEQVVHGDHQRRRTRLHGGERGGVEDVVRRTGCGRCRGPTPG